jgi:hypothetical protein
MEGSDAAFGSKTFTFARAPWLQGPMIVSWGFFKVMNRLTKPSTMPESSQQDHRRLSFPALWSVL